ncbi:MAG: deoxyribonuclease IV [Gaiellales bacterium]
MLFGAHVSSSGGIHTAIDRAEQLGAQAVQVFTQSPRMWKPTAHSDESCRRFRERRREAGIGSVVCHATYLINLGATDDTIYHRSVAALRSTVEVAHRIGAEGVIFHPGSHLGRGLDAALEQVVPALQITLGARPEDGPWLLLENTAGQNGPIGASVEQLARIIDHLGAPDRVGICLDSCHLYASGVDITSPETLDELLDEVDGRIGLERLRCLHVNDSKTPLGSCRDRHENVGQGAIGSGLAVFLGHPRLQHLPAVMETPGADGHGADAAEMRAIGRLHRRGLKLWERQLSA